eukprot:jgi/Ulvmu1/6744/UM030_0079.1
MASRFADKVVLVTGASGQIGGGIARQFLVEGAKVVAPVRSQTSADSVVEHVAPAGADRLEVLISNLADETSTSTVATSVKAKYGHIDHFVSVAGGWWGGGELSQQSVEEVKKQLDTFAIPHFLYYKHFAPLLKDDSSSSFTFVSGAGGADYIPSACLLTVGAAALFGISITARGEYAEKAPRINECRLAAFVARHDEAEAQGKQSNYAMGKVVADMAASDMSGEVKTISEDDLKNAEITE